MGASTELFITVGLFFLLGLSADAIARKFSIPRVTLIVIVGILVGPQVFDWLPSSVQAQFDGMANIALVMVGFLLGGSLTRDTFSRLGASLFWVSVFEVLCTFFLVAMALLAIGTDWPLALILGCIGAATAAEIAFDAVCETKTHSPFSKLLLGVVALDDVWSLLLFSVVVVIVGALAAGEQINSFGFVGKELLGGILLGLVLGLPAALLTGRLKPGEPILLEALGLVFLCAGLAHWFGVSFLLAAIVMGATIANLASHHDRPFHAIENIEWPFLLLFFALAGAQLQFDALWSLGWIGLVYVLSRILGKWLGAYLGASLVKLPKITRRWMGLSLLPQAGAAIGMALVAAAHFPQYQQQLLQIIIATTVLFEITAPAITEKILKITH